MKNLKLISQIPLIFFLIIALYYFFLHKEKIEINSEDSNHFEHLDLIVSNGQSAMSKIENLLNFEVKGYTHIGIIINEQGNFYILHSTPDGTKQNGIRCDDIQTYMDLSNVNYFKIFRLKNLSQSNVDQINKALMYYKTVNIPFDYSFDNLDKSKIYCSELVYEIFKSDNLLSFRFDLTKPIRPEEITNMIELKNVYERKSTENLVVHSRH